MVIGINSDNSFFVFFFFNFLNHYFKNTDSVCFINRTQYLGGGDILPPWVFPLWQPERVSPSAHAL